MDLIKKDSFEIKDPGLSFFMKIILNFKDFKNILSLSRTQDYLFHKVHFEFHEERQGRMLSVNFMNKDNFESWMNFMKEDAFEIQGLQNELYREGWERLFFPILLYPEFQGISFFIKFVQNFKDTKAKFIKKNILEILNELYREGWLRIQKLFFPYPSS